MVVASAVSTSIDELADATPPERSRVVDFLRGFSICVVILWHWVFSVTHWDDHGALTMPNPVGDVRLLWLATWLLQVMPLFFIVGGFSNLAAFESLERRGAGWWTFVRCRLRRLLRPVGVFVVVWATGDLAARLLIDGYQGVTTWGRAVFVPLWFLGVYTVVVVLAPLTIKAHRAGRELVLVLAAAAIVLADLGRFRFGMPSLGLLNAGLVWLFAHQLGYFWRDGSLSRAPRRVLWSIAASGLAALVVLTNLGVYPRSMVAVRGEAISNMFPTTACIAALAFLQLGVVQLARPGLERWLTRRGPWKVTVAVNTFAMTVFTWHMTALVAAIALWERLGGTLRQEPTTRWWLERPVWVALPGLFLAGLVWVFARVELNGRRRPARSATPQG